MKKGKVKPTFIKFIKTKKIIVFLVIIFFVHVFFRFYQLEERMGFGWDQANISWVAKEMIVDHKYPLIGMIAKATSGFHIGPIYYYYVMPFYFIFGLDPIASPITAGVTSIISFFVLYFVISRIFFPAIGLIAIAINAVSSFIAIADRTQWPVGFIVPLSALIYYMLYNIMKGKSKYILTLSVLVGFSMHIHFTSAFYFILILLTLPFWPRTRLVALYSLVSIPIFVLWLIPSAVSQINHSTSDSSSMISYIQTYYHGIHLRRLLQVVHDGFIELELILGIRWLSFLQYLLLPIFLLTYVKFEKNYHKVKLLYLCAIWFLVPWFVFSTYSGEISNYYFYMTRPVALMIFAYLTYKIFVSRYLIAKAAIIVFWTLAFTTNIQTFLRYEDHEFTKAKKRILEYIESGRMVKKENTADSYLYYYYTNHKKQL